MLQACNAGTTPIATRRADGASGCTGPPAGTAIRGTRVSQSALGRLGSVGNVSSDWHHMIPDAGWK